MYVCMYVCMYTDMQFTPLPAVHHYHHHCHRCLSNSSTSQSILFAHQLRTKIAMARRIRSTHKWKHTHSYTHKHVSTDSKYHNSHSDGMNDLNERLSEWNK